MQIRFRMSSAKALWEFQIDPLPKLETTRRWAFKTEGAVEESRIQPGSALS